MRLLYYSNPYFADADFPLVRTMQQKGCDVTYLIELAPYNLHATIFDIKKQIPKSAILSAFEYPELNIFRDYIDLSKVYIVNRTVWKESAFANLKLTLKVILFILKGRFNIIHTDFFYTKYNTLLYLFRKKTILTVHDPIPHTGEKDKQLERYKKISFRLLNKFVLLNEKQTEGFSNGYKVPISKIRYNRLGIYDCLNVYKNTYIKPRKNSILFFGRISPYKGLDILCESMIYVSKNHPEIELTIAGSGDIYFDDSEYHIPSIKWIHEFIGVDKLVQIIQQCEIVVVPYIDATQSGVIMTAHALGRPVIATAVGGLVDAIIDGETGLLVKAKSSHELAQAIIGLLGDMERMDHIKSSIEQVYLEGEHSWHAIGDKYLDIYTNFLKE